MANKDEKVEVCRLCGKESRNCFPIFQGEDNILEKINICLPINKISPDDKLPSNVCKCCSYHLSISYKLRCTAVEVDERLRMQLYQRQTDDVYTNKDTNNFSENFLNIKREIIDEKNVLHYQNNTQEIRDKLNIHNNWKTNREDIDEIRYKKETVVSTEDNETAMSVNLVTEIDIVEMKYEDVMEASIEQTDNTEETLSSKCHKSSRSNQSISHHIQNEHKKKEYVCDQCGKCYSSHQLRWHHVQREHKKEYVCDQCGKCFNSYSSRWQHVQREHKKEHVCDQCGKCFSSYHSKWQHVQCVHKKKKYVCDQCGKCYNSYYLKWQHTQREHKKMEYVCDHCGKCFNFKANLCYHIWTHLPVEDRKYQCDICQKKFITNSNLTVHKRIHSGVRPYKCDVCSFSFRYLDSMKRHRMLKHFKNENKHAKNTLSKNILCDRENFVCDYCGKCFRVKNYLRAHISTHLPVEARKYQ